MNTREELLEIEKQYLETAKRILKAEGHLLGMTFIITNAQGALKCNGQFIEVDAGSHRDVATDVIEKLAQEQSDQLVPVAVPNQINVEEGMEILLSAMDEKQRAFVLETISIGHATGAKDVIARTLKAVLGAMRLHEKDLIALRIKKICRKVGAFAVIKIDDGYTISTALIKGTSAEEQRAKFAKSLEDEPLATEAVVCCLETEEFIHISRCPYERVGGKNSDTPVLKFNEDQFEQLLIERNDPEMKAMGRFVGLLKPIRGNTATSYVHKTTPEA